MDNNQKVFSNNQNTTTAVGAERQAVGAGIPVQSVNKINPTLSSNESVEKKKDEGGVMGIVPHLIWVIVAVMFGLLTYTKVEFYLLDKAVTSCSQVAKVSYKSGTSGTSQTTIPMKTQYLECLRHKGINVK